MDRRLENKEILSVKWVEINKQFKVGVRRAGTPEKLDYGSRQARWSLEWTIYRRCVDFLRPNRYSTNFIEKTLRLLTENLWKLLA